ncbi:hypothetical protein FKM82_015723 [Ascaphus truei]
MMFLKEQMLPARTESNLEETSTQDDSFVEMTFVEDEVVPVCVAAAEPVAKKSRSTNDLCCKMINIEEQKFGLLHEMMADSNEDMDFFLSFLQYITPLDKMSKLCFR